MSEKQRKALIDNYTLEYYKLQIYENRRVPENILTKQRQVLKDMECMMKENGLSLVELRENLKPKHVLFS